MQCSKIIVLIFFSLSFTQVRFSYELDNDSAFLVGYDKIFIKQKNINSGIGIEYSITESPDNMRFNSLYSIVNYNIEDTWNLYSKVGLSLFQDKTGFLSKSTGLFLGVGMNYYFKEKFHLELGYHIAYIDGYEHSRVVYSIIKHFKFDEK